MTDCFMARLGPEGICIFHYQRKLVNLIYRRMNTVDYEEQDFGRCRALSIMLNSLALTIGFIPKSVLKTNIGVRSATNKIEFGNIYFQHTLRSVQTKRYYHEQIAAYILMQPQFDTTGTMTLTKMRESGKK